MHHCMISYPSSMISQLLQCIFLQLKFDINRKTHTSKREEKQRTITRSKRSILFLVEYSEIMFPTT